MKREKKIKQTAVKDWCRSRSPMEIIALRIENLLAPLGMRNICVLNAHIDVVTQYT